jgi:hypothetical protein
VGLIQMLQLHLCYVYALSYKPCTVRIDQRAKMSVVNANLSRPNAYTSTSTLRRTVASSRPVVEKRMIPPTHLDADRRIAISAVIASVLQLRGICAPEKAQAIQGTTAGRIPGGYEVFPTLLVELLIDSMGVCNVRVGMYPPSPLCLAMYYC